MNDTLIILITTLTCILFALVSLLFIKDFDLYKKAREKLKKFLSRSASQDVIEMITNVSAAVKSLSEDGHGSIIVIERKDNIEPLFMDNQKIDAKINANLLINIFSGVESQPLHDGATVISNGRIAYSNAFVKKLTKAKIDKKYGARHRAALGLSEQCDAIVIITSEERKGVSIAMDGRIVAVPVEKFFDDLSEIIFGSHRGEK